MKHLNHIKKALQIMQLKSSVLPILERACIHENKLLITDLNTSAIFKDVDIPVNFVLDNKKFIATCVALGNPSFNKDGNTLTISNSDEVFTYAIDDFGDFPKIDIEATQIGEISPDDNRLIKLALSVVSKNELRPAMCMVAIKDGYIMATDGHTAIYNKSDFAYSSPILIGRKCALLLGMFPNDPFKISISESRLVFENDIMIVTQRLDDNKFPDLLAVVPKESQCVIKVDKKEIVSTVKKALICAPTTTYTAIFDINNRLTISADNIIDNQTYKRQISCDKTGVDLRRGLNAKMLLNLLKGVTTSDVTIEFVEDEKKPIVINGYALQMPVNLNRQM